MTLDTPTIVAAPARATPAMDRPPYTSHRTVAQVWAEQDRRLVEMRRRGHGVLGCAHALDMLPGEVRARLEVLEARS